MKLKILLSILFVLMTTLSAMHEIEHINHEHNSDSCQVCILNKNLVSSDLSIELNYVELFLFEALSLQKITSTVHTKKQTDQNRAPPCLS